jgi:hypothetical protein
MASRTFIDPLDALLSLPFGLLSHRGVTSRATEPLGSTPEKGVVPCCMPTVSVRRLVTQGFHLLLERHVRRNPDEMIMRMLPVSVLNDSTGRPTRGILHDSRKVDEVLFPEPVILLLELGKVARHHGRMIS